MKNEEMHKKVKTGTQKIIDENLKNRPKKKLKQLEENCEIQETDEKLIKAERK